MISTKIVENNEACIRDSAEADKIMQIMQIMMLAINGLDERSYQNKKKERKEDRIEEPN